MGFSSIHEWIDGWVDEQRNKLDGWRKLQQDRLRLMINSVQLLNHESLGPHGLQHARPPCPSPTARVHPNPCPLSRWCHPTILSAVVPFSSHLQSFPASGSFQMSQLFTSGGQSIGVSASTLVLPMNIQDWSPLGGTCEDVQLKGRRARLGARVIARNCNSWVTRHMVRLQWWSSDRNVSECLRRLIRRGRVGRGKEWEYWA